MSKLPGNPQPSPTAQGNVARRQGYYYKAARQFDAAIAGGPTTLGDSRAKAGRGVAKVGMGFLKQIDADGLPGAIEDLEAAVAEHATDGWAWAQLGEAYRIHGRDEFKALDSDVLRELVGKALGAFEKALEYAPENRAWILAHRGAAHFLALVVQNRVDLDGPSESSSVGLTFDDSADLYKRAERDFQDAIKAFPNYAWAKQFLAFLFTVVGKHKQAISLLGEALLDAGDISPPLLRSLSLLYRYSARMEPEPDDRRQALEQALYTGQRVLAADYEDYVATYSVAASALELGYPEARDVCRSARNRLLNTVARIIPFAVALHNESGDSADLSEIFDKHVRQADIETAAILGQDPLWSSGEEAARGYQDTWATLLDKITG